MYLWQRHATARWLNLNEAGLETCAPGGVAIIDRPDRARSLVQVACNTENQASLLVQRFRGSAHRLPRSWQQSFLQHESGPPIRIGRRLLVLAEASRLVARTNEKQLVIPAAGAFGTGQHATTALCLRLLEKTTRNFSLGWRMLDAGAGSGILALAASCFGAGQVLAIDHDPRALAHARRNARLNRIRNVAFVRQDFLRWKPDARYDIITANLFSEILIAALPLFRRALRKRGRLILSGILRAQAAPVLLSLGKSYFRLEELRRCGKWVALLATNA